MRILLAGAKSCPPRIGGIEVFVFQLGKRLAARGFDVSVVVPRIPGERRTETISGMLVTRIPVIKERHFMKVSMIPNLVAAANHLRPDVFHANDPASGIASATRGQWSKSLLTVHGAGFSKSEWPTPFRQGGKLLQAIAVKCATRVVATDASTSELIKRIRDDVLVVPPGVDTNLFKEAREGGLCFDEKEKIQILFVGRLTEVKGFDLLVRSLEYLRPDVRERIRINVVGSGPLRRMIDETHPKRGILNWVGEQPHEAMPSFYASAHFMVMPSRSEGVPVAMLEAMSSGLPVVGTLVGGVGRIFDERHIFRIKEPSAEAVARSIEAAIDHNELLSERAKRAKELVTAQFSWDRMTERYLEIYSQYLAE